MKTKSLMLLSLICLSAPLAAQGRPSSDIDVLAAALSDPAVAPADKIAALERITSDDLSDFQTWNGKLAPGDEMALSLSLENVILSADSSNDRFRAVQVYGYFARWFADPAARSKAVSDLKELALLNDQGDPRSALVHPALFALAELAKSPAKIAPGTGSGLDQAFSDQIVGAGMEILNRYRAGVVGDQAGEEYFTGLLVLHNYLEYHLRGDAEGNNVGDFQDRVESMPAWPAGLSMQLGELLLSPAQNSVDRLYTPQNTSFRGVLAATLIDLARVDSMDFGTLQQSREILSAMAYHSDPDRAIAFLVARYRTR